MSPVFQEPKIRSALEISGRLGLRQHLIMTPRIRMHVDKEEWRRQLNLPQRIKPKIDETEEM